NVANHPFDSRRRNLSLECWKEDIMYGRTAFITGAVLTLVASATLAQQPSTAANPTPNSDASQSGRPQAATSQEEVRQEVRRAGFDNIEFLQSAYVVRATNKNGTKLVMTITPESVRAIAVAPNQQSGTAGQGSIAGAPSSGTGISGQAGNKNGPAASSSGTQ